MKRVWRLVVLSLGVGVCSTSALAESGKAVIQATLPNNKGFPVSGTAALNDTPEGLAVSVQVANVPPGQHGLHIHEFGECADAGKAAGGHFNPANTPHGFLPKDGVGKAHAGDMGNIDIGPDGSGALTVTLSGVTLSSGPHSVAGRAIILHEKVDDFGQPTGNAGGRIGCGVIQITGQ